MRKTIRRNMALTTKTTIHPFFCNNRLTVNQSIKESECIQLKIQAYTQVEWYYSDIVTTFLEKMVPTITFWISTLEIDSLQRKETYQKPWLHDSNSAKPSVWKHTVSTEHACIEKIAERLLSAKYILCYKEKGEIAQKHFEMYVNYQSDSFRSVCI